MRSDRVQAVTISDEHWLDVAGVDSSAILGSQCSCGGQCGSCGGWSAAAQDTETSTTN
jgi:bacterioferritin-associated ferredoxin